MSDASTNPSRRGVLAGMSAGAAAAALSSAPAQADGLQPAPLREWFEAYFAAFNHREYESFGAYYADDVQFHGQAATLSGRDAVLQFYRGVHARLNERVDLLTFVGDEQHIAAEIRTTLTANEDWPDFPTGALMKGDTRASINFVLYDLTDRHFTRVRSARYQRL